MASEKDLKELQDQQASQRQSDHLNREQEEHLRRKSAEQTHEFGKMSAEQIQKVFEEMQKKHDAQLAEKDALLAKKDTEIKQLRSEENPSTPPHHTSLIPDGKAFDSQSCTPRAAELTSSRVSRE
jgi:hypothetical protein